MKCLQVGVFAICAAAVQTYAALPLDGVVPPYVYSEVTVTGQTTVTGLAVSGTLEKRGSGELTLTDLLSLPGTVLVREGSVTLAESGFSAALPTALQRGLAFWVDANTNLVLSGSRTVEKWLDVRETSTSEPYAYMRAEHDFTHYSEGPRSRKPTRVQGVSDVNGLPMVDFGTFGATDTTAAWLPWRLAPMVPPSLAGSNAICLLLCAPCRYHRGSESQPAWVGRAESSQRLRRRPCVERHAASP